MQSNYQKNLNDALRELHDTRSISSALLVCNILLGYMGAETKDVEDIELSKLKLPNAERYDRWFESHPHFRGERACFDLTQKENATLEAKFYALKKRSKLFIAGAVNFTPNFEDREYTRNDPNMKVGIDFFFPPEKDSVLVVLSNRGILRLVELSKRLTNTQHEIFDLWQDIAKTQDRNIFHITMWESFKLSSLNKKFYEGIANSFTSLTQHMRAGGVDEQLANQFANRLHGRLLFLWFLRKKHIINESKGYFVLDTQDDTEYYDEKLAYLFFNVLNTAISERDRDQKGKETLFGREKEAPTLFVIDSETPYLNGGLFDPKSDGEYWNAHKPSFPKGFFRTLYDHFDSFNFTTDESTPEYEQIAIDPEMLGRIFESFLATLKTETGAQAKKANGAFYTPREIVSYMSRESLRQYLYTALEASELLKSSIDELLDRSDSEWAISGTNSKRDTVAKEDRERIMVALQAIRVLDPAVGSGAFPMGILHKILSVFERLDPSFDPYEIKLAILRDNIYGADIDPTAVEISRLRAWLSIIVDVKDIKKVKPLPNLDFKFVCANSLIGLEKSSASFSTDENLKPELIRIRGEYYATSNKRIKEKLQKEYIKLTHKESLFDTVETRQLKSYKPFQNGHCASFYDAELMHGVEKFDVVIGNPPYVQIQKFARTQMQANLENSRYKTFSKTGDIYSLFYERGLEMTNRGSGLLCFITSNKWMRAGYGEKLRDYFAHKNPLQLLDFGGFKVFESATVDTNILLIENRENQQALLACHFKNDYRRGDDLREYCRGRAVNMQNLSVGTWFIGSKEEIALKAKIEKIGKPLKDWDVKINYGIKTGLNEAFIINQKMRDELVEKDPKSAEIIKPILRGRDIKRYGYEWVGLYVIGTFPALKIDIDNFPVVKKYFLDFGKDRLDQSGAKLLNGKTSRKKTGNKWFETQDQISYYEEFEKEKVIYPVMSSKASFYYDNQGFYCNDKGFIITGDNLKYLIAVLNSKITHHYLKQVCSPLGDAAVEYRKIYLDTFPIPVLDRVEKRSLSENIENRVDQILTIKKSNPKADTKSLEKEIDQLVYQLYGLTEEEIAIIEGR